MPRTALWIISFSRNGPLQDIKQGFHDPDMFSKFCCIWTYIAFGKRRRWIMLYIVAQRATVYGGICKAVVTYAARNHYISEDLILIFILSDKVNSFAAMYVLYC